MASIELPLVCGHLGGGELIKMGMACDMYVDRVSARLLLGGQCRRCQEPSRVGLYQSIAGN